MRLKIYTNHNQKDIDWVSHACLIAVSTLLMYFNFSLTSQAQTTDEPNLLSMPYIPLIMLPFNQAANDPSSTLAENWI